MEEVWSFLMWSQWVEKPSKLLQFIYLYTVPEILPTLFRLTDK